MSIEIIILALFASGIISYLFTKIFKVLGALVTVIASLGALGIIYYYGETLQGTSEVIHVDFFNFNITSLGIFFAITMLIVYSMVSFFNLYWMKKLLHPASYNMLYLMSLASTLGLFFASDFIWMFIFFEFVVWTSLFIIPLGKSRHAAIVYYAVSALGTFALLLAILLTYNQYQTFVIKDVLESLSNDPKLATTVYILFGITAIAKLGSFPLHIWLPLAHGSAPDTFSPVLSGGLVKMGAYIAIIMVIGMNTSTTFASSIHVLNIPIQNYTFMFLGGISIVIGTLMAIAQDDAKKLLAYSSVANGGYIMIGIATADSIGLSGALFHIFAHALATSAAFMAIAVVSYRTGTTKISQLGGMIHKMPITFLVYLIAIISMAGIPPMAGFISKWLIFQTLTHNGLIFIATAAFFGSIGSFLYVFRPLAGLFLGQKLPIYEKVKEAPFFMVIPMLILSTLSIFFGIFPSYAWKYIDPILKEYGLTRMNPTLFELTGYNGSLNAPLIAGIFGVGVITAFIIFLLLPKSRKVNLMDTYTAGEFIYTPELLHYAKDFYAPLERMYAKHPSILKFYEQLVQKIEELGQFVKYLFFSKKLEVTIFWIVAIITIILVWGGNI